MVGAYDNNHDEGHDIYLCIFTDRAKDDRYENKIITTLIMPVQDFQSSAGIVLKISTNITYIILKKCTCQRIFA